MKYKLIALDLDGTLKNSHNEITPKTKEALLKVQSQGVHIVLASGRPTPGLRHDMKALELDTHDGYLLSYNGARVFNAQSKETIYAQELDKEDAIKIIEKAKELKLLVNTYTDDVLLTETPEGEYVQVEANITDLPIVKVDSLADSLPSPLYKLLLSETPEYVASKVDEMVAAFPNLAIYRSAPFFIECMANGIDKANSLAQLAKHLGIRQEEVMAFGDGYNDMPMIRYAGLGVAMANAVDGVKEAADYITLSNDEDGIAAVLEKYFDLDK